MAGKPMEIELAISIDELRKEIQGDLEREGIEPVSVTIDSDHAAFLEFGTDGSSEGKTPYKEILAWARTKPNLAKLPPSEQKRAAYMIKRKIDREGTDPHPFIAPALKDLVETDIVTRLKMGATTYDLADGFISNMKWHLELNKSIYKWDVYNSMSVHKGGEWGHGNEDLNIYDIMKELEEEMHSG